jgi:hypothetical protein
MIDTTRYDQAAAAVIQEAARAFRATETAAPPVCPACEAGFHGEHADAYHVAFKCSCPCSGASS